MALVVAWEKISLDRENQPALVLKRNEALPDFVTDFVRSTLVMIGAVRDYDVPVQTVQAAVDAELAVKDTPPPATPPEVMPVKSDGTPVDPKPDAPAVEKPATSDSKDAWEAYAVYQGYMSQTEAEAMTKTKLVAEVNKRENV